MGIDYRIQRKEGYLHYHSLMVRSGDCDPAYPALRYLSNRFELNREQRFWLAWLYSVSYCTPTAYYMLSEFPDYENVDVGRLNWWWTENKHKCLFQTDRAKVKNLNNLVPMYQSYRKLTKGSQSSFYSMLLRATPEKTYDAVFKKLSNLYCFGRYSLFLLTEAVYELTGFPMKPTGLDLREAQSCRNGLLYALGKETWLKHKHDTLTAEQYRFLQQQLIATHDAAEAASADYITNYWNIETTLCAYKKLFYKTRYFGYYIDRMMVEIKEMEKRVRQGVDWSVLWDFRKEHFDARLLGESRGWQGIRQGRYKLVIDTGHPAPDLCLDAVRKKPVAFPHSEKSYIPNSNVTLQI